MRPRVVPFRRELREGSQGRDVTAVQRALAAAGFTAHDGPRAFGPKTASSVGAFQRAQHLPADRVYGPQTHRKLARFFDAYGAWLMGVRDDAPDSAQGMRAAVVGAMTLLLNNRDAVHYSQGPRRMEGVTRKLRPPEFPRYADCSSAATWAYFVAGAPDPNGRDYDGLGYTGTLCQHGRAVALAAAKPGDLVFYGRSAPWEHVAVFVGAGRVISHGSERGPFLLAIDYRPDRGEVRSYLR